MILCIYEICASALRVPPLRPAFWPLSAVQPASAGNIPSYSASCNTRETSAFPRTLAPDTISARTHALFRASNDRTAVLAGNAGSSTPWRSAAPRTLRPRRSRHDGDIPVPESTDHADVSADSAVDNNQPSSLPFRNLQPYSPDAICREPSFFSSAYQTIP